jgi:multiple sugar transport system ATP-binding protein
MNLVHAEVLDGAVSFAGFRIPLDRRRAPAARPRSLVLGIRPEAFEDAAFAAPGLPQIDATPTVIEELGADAHVIFRIDAPAVELDDVKHATEDEALLVAGQTFFNARVNAKTTARVGVPMRLALDPAELHFFDAETGENVTSSSPTALAVASK